MNPPELGAHVRVHHGRWASGLFGVVPLVALSLALWVGLAVLRPSSAGFVTGFALVCSAMAALVTVQTARDASTRVTVYERGIEWSRGREQGRFGFSEITRFETFNFGRQPSGIRITTANGSVIRLPGSVTEPTALLSSLAGKVPPAALPKATLRKH